MLAYCTCINAGVQGLLLYMKSPNALLSSIPRYGCMYSCKSLTSNRWPHRWDIGWAKQAIDLLGTRPVNSFSTVYWCFRPNLGNSTLTQQWTNTYRITVWYHRRLSFVYGKHILGLKMTGCDEFPSGSFNRTGGARRRVSYDGSIRALSFLRTGQQPDSLQTFPQ